MESCDVTTHSSGEGGSVLLDIQVPVSDASKEFMDKLRFRRRRASQPAQGEDNNSAAREDLVRARAVLKAIAWIQDVLLKGAVQGSMVNCVPALLLRIILTISSLFTVDWGRLRHDELSTGKLCDTAYMLGNVVR